MPAPDQSRPPGWLDGAETIVSTIYLALLGVVAIAAIGAVAYLLLHRPATFGAQGEWFYVGGGFLLVMFWVVSQAMSAIRRVRRGSSSPTPEIPGPKVTSSPSGLSFTWGTPPDQPESSAQKGWSWNFQMGGPRVMRTFAIDATQLATARAARASGATWNEISQQLNSDYASLDPIEQALYEQALQHAVERSETPPGGA